MKYFYVLSHLFIVLNGERVGGCPSSINNSSARTYDECQMDTDCATNDLHKCCRNEFGIKECVNPIPGNISVEDTLYHSLVIRISGITIEILHFEIANLSI